MQNEKKHANYDILSFFLIVGNIYSVVVVADDFHIPPLKLKKVGQ